MTSEIAPTPSQLPLANVREVVFYKRDEITADLICCEVKVDDQVWFFHEEAREWSALILHLEALPGFCREWFSVVSRSVFAESRTVAFRR